MDKKPRTIRDMDLRKSDLHVHSNRSDGVLSVQEVVNRIQSKGNTIMALTDHDGIYGVSDAKKFGEKEGIEVIAGIEFSAEGPNSEGLHILGYYIDIENQVLKKAVEDVRRWREERNIKIYEALTKMGLPISAEDFAGMPNKDYVGKPTIARKLVEKGLLEKYEDAFLDGKYFDSDEIRKIKKRKLSAEEIIRVIKESGGLSVLAHPMKIKKINHLGEKEFWEKLEDLVVELKGFGLGGLECYYPTHTVAHQKRIIDMANRLDLFVTKGTDFHFIKEDEEVEE